MKHTYVKADAFSTDGSLGNPAACLYLKPGEALTDAQMLAVAKEHKGFVSEFVFCSQPTPGQYALCYYSSECEVDFCGHGTIACLYWLIKSTPALRALPHLDVQTRRKGTVRVYNQLDDQDAVFISAPAPSYIGTLLQPADIPIEQIDPALPLDVIDAGLRTLLVPIRGLDALTRLAPDEATLKAFCLKQGLDIVTCFCMEAEQSSRFAHTRVFAPKFGYLEDPATGSGSSALGYYWLKNRLWDGKNIALEQGGHNMCYNMVCLSAPDGRVRFGGGAVTRIEGDYILS